MKSPKTVKALEDFGRELLSQNFFMRDFLFSDIATIYGIPNIPEYPDRAIEAGRKLCMELLEPPEDRFGRIAIRSAYRPAAVSQHGNEHGLNCGSNESNAAKHIWDQRDVSGNLGATACIVIPRFWDRYQQTGDWRRLAWWIHDHLPYSELYFFKNRWAFNITYNEKPKRRIDSYAAPAGCLTKAGETNHIGSHQSHWTGIEELFVSSRLSQPAIATC